MLTNSRRARDPKVAGQDILDVLEGISYLVDLEGRIVALGRTNWNQFATENGAADLLNEKDVIGRKLSDFISGSEVQDSYATLTEQLKSDPATKVAIAYRCDSPTERRDMRLSISAVRSGGRLVGYLYVSTTLSTQSRPHLNVFDFQSMIAWAENQQALRMLAMCSYCQRLNCGDEVHEDWVEAPEYYRRGGTDAVKISHGICQGCLDRILGPQS
jgi:hypothetical protein